MIARTRTAAASSIEIGWALVAGIVAAVGAVVAVINPMVAVSLVIVVGVALILRSLAAIALLALVAGPMLASRYSIGALTVDNWLVLVGIGLATWCAVSRSRLPFVKYAIFPLALAFSIAVSGLANGVEFVSPVLRYIGVACVPLLLLGQRGLPFKKAEKIVLFTVAVGALSVVTQPFLPLVRAYTDPDTGVIRFGGLFGHPNFAACVLSIATLYLVCSGKLGRRRKLLVALFVVSVLVTASLGAILSLVLGILIIVMRRPSHLFSVLAIGFAGIAVFGATLLERVGFLLAAGSQENSLTWRFNRWEAAIRLTTDPNLVGIGWQQAEVSLRGAIHSTFVAVYVELGLLGSILAFLALVVFARLVVRDRYGVATFAFVLVASFTDPVLIYPSTLTALIGFSVLHLQRVQKRAEAGGSSLSSEASAGQVDVGAGGSQRFAKDLPR